MPRLPGGGVYIPNPNFEHDFINDQADDYNASLEGAAERVKAEAERFVQRIMPRNAASAFEVQVDVGEGVVRVVNTDYGSWIAEVGSVNSPAYAPLRRAVTAAGYRLEVVGPG